jgi:hypothetical protein
LFIQSTFAIGLQLSVNTFEMIQYIPFCGSACLSSLGVYIIEIVACT